MRTTVTLDPDVNSQQEYIKGTYFWHMDGMTESQVLQSNNLGLGLVPQHPDQIGVDRRRQLSHQTLERV